MRLMAYLSPLVWWWSQADPTFRDTFNGFVWEEPAPTGKGWQVVGNVSLSRAPGSRQHWIICNVVVEERYRERGIARRLLEAAIAAAQSLAAQGVVLQVHRDNVAALALYLSLGFREAAGETDLWLDAVRPVALLDAPGYQLRPWSRADGRAAYELARWAMPRELQWLRPLQASDYAVNSWGRLGQWLSATMTGRRVYRLAALQEDRLAAILMVVANFRHGEHRLALLVDPEHAGKVEASLVSRALHMLAAIPSRPVRAVADPAQTALHDTLQQYGFREQRTLLTLHKDF
jgi:GNAT superfamily N-acetyltransferase